MLEHLPYCCLLRLSSFDRLIFIEDKSEFIVIVGPWYPDALWNARLRRSAGRNVYLYLVQIDGNTGHTFLGTCSSWCYHNSRRPWYDETCVGPCNTSSSHRTPFLWAAQESGYTILDGYTVLSAPLTLNCDLLLGCLYQAGYAVSSAFKLLFRVSWDGVSYF